MLSSQAYEKYNDRRTIAIKALKAEKAKGIKISVPACVNAFHDGRNVLSAVTEWHVYLRNSARKADTTTHRVLDLVDHYMLLPNPEERVMMGELCDRLDEIILLSKQEYQQKLDNNFLRPVGSETLGALRDLDDQAPSKAAIAQAARAEVGMRNQNEYGGRSQTEAVDERLERQNRPRKSERFDKIVFAKTANRVQNSQLLPEISESPKQLPEETRLISGISGPRHEQQQEKIPDMRLDSSDSPWVGKPTPIWPPREQPLDVQPYKTTSPESISPGLPDTGSSHQKDVQSSSTASNESFKAIPSGAFELPGSGAARKSASAAGTSQLPNLVRNLPPEASSTQSRTSIHEECCQGPLPTIEGSDPELTKTAIFQEYTVLNENWADRKKSLIKRIQGVPQDQRLQRFISKRDVVRLLPAPQPIFPFETDPDPGLCG